MEQAKACEKALNNFELQGKVITVSVQFQHNPNPKANLYIQNLSAQTTQKQIYDLFSTFGSIIKCKLECYNDGTSRGYCFVQFEKE